MTRTRGASRGGTGSSCEGDMENEDVKVLEASAFLWNGLVRMDFNVAEVDILIWSSDCSSAEKSQRGRQLSKPLGPVIQNCRITFCQAYHSACSGFRGPTNCLTEIKRWCSWEPPWWTQ